MGFPYGDQETFLINELTVLCENFDHVYIIPFKRKSLKYRNVNLPNNCIILNPVFNSSLKKINFFNVFPILINFIKLLPFPFNRSAINNALICSIIQSGFFHSSAFNIIREKHIGKDIHYFYWGYGLAYILKKLKNKLNAPRCIVRFHGFDLYEERHNGWLPVRYDLASEAEQLHFISKQGRNYFNEKYPKSIEKSYLSYLGVLHGYEVKRPNNSKSIHFYSCSNIIELKRVDFILKSILAFACGNKNIEVTWEHFGDGDLFSQLSDQIKTIIIPNNFSIITHGRQSSENIFKEYKHEKKSIFINLSTTEGLPVSIMEAMSYNIPILATDVGGVSELVTSEVGLLVNASSSIDEIMHGIKDIVKNYKKFTPYQIWMVRFHAENNYKKFIENINIEIDV